MPHAKSFPAQAVFSLWPGDIRFTDVASVAVVRLFEVLCWFNGI